MTAPHGTTLDSLRRARRRAGLSLRQLARRAGTSHSAIAAYESGRVEPTVGTFERLLAAAGFDVDVRLRPVPAGAGGGDRGDELAQALLLAEQFPARHAPTIQMPPFARPVAPARP